MKRRRALVWLLILALALTLRLIGLRYGLPAVYNPDEVAIMSRALAFAKGDFNPHNFLYPSFYFYALFAWEGLTAVLALATRSLATFGEFQREFFLDPTRVFVAGRLLTALLGAATVGAVGVLGSRIWSPAAGIAAALLLAVSPLHVLNSHYVKHDVPVAFLITVAYLAYARLWIAEGEARAGRWRLAAAAVTGVAFSTHYYAIFLAIPLAWSVALRASNRAEAVRRIVVAAAVSAAVFFLLSPYILVEPATALRDIRANRQIVVDRGIGTLGYASSGMRYGALLLFDTIGIPGALLALIGLGVGGRRHPTRTLWLLAFSVPFLLFIASTFPASRYLVPVAPFVAIFGGIAVAELHRKQPLLAGLVAAVAVGAAGREALRADTFIRHADTRTLALEYVRAHVPAGATILMQPYSVPLEPTAEVLGEAVARSGLEMPTKTRLQMARTPYPVPAYRLVYLGRGMDADKIYLPYDQLNSDPAAALRHEHVAFVILKQYNDGTPATTTLLATLAEKGRRIAEFSPYSYTRGTGSPRTEPFLHNSDARITGALERPGPVVEIWQIDGPGS